MTIVLAVKGLRFSPAAGLNLSQVITPPYDVITPERQDQFYHKSPYNVIRLEYPKSLPGDDFRTNKYTRAKTIFNDWKKKGILIQEERPALYLYEQYFVYNKKKYMRSGLFCGVGLSPFAEGKIIPHEETMNKPKADRLKLLRHCETNFSPIFGLFKDKDRLLDHCSAHFKKQQQPVINFTDDDGQQHKLWAVTDKSFISTVKNFFLDKKIYIADGHHRYETALEFFLQKKQGGENSDTYGHVLMALVNIYDEGLLAFPTHRAITQSSMQSKELLEQLAKKFEITELPEPGTEDELLKMLDESLTGATEKNLSFGLYTLEKKFFILTLKDLQAEEKPFPWLDTVVLQRLVLADIFMHNDRGREKTDLIYLRDEWEGKLQVDRGQARFIFFVNRPPLETIISLAEKGIRMPEKSTYFYPKFSTGLIMLQLGS